MTTIIKHSNEPLAFQITFQEDLDATYQLVDMSFIPNKAENSAQITLNLEKISDTPSPFNHSFTQKMNELDGGLDITITVSTSNTNGPIITHQEGGTHIERPIRKNRW
jgi:hypothetical protein